MIPRVRTIQKLTISLNFSMATTFRIFLILFPNVNIYTVINILLQVQFSSVAHLCPTLCNPMNWSTPGLPVQHQLLEFIQTHVHRVRNAIQSCHPLSSPFPFPLAPNPSQHRVFSNESTLRMRWPKYWSFSFSIIHSKEHPGLISFRMDWLDLLAVQGLSRVFSNTTVQKHQFFSAQLSSQSNSHIHT